MAFSLTIRHEVQFVETDMAGIVHFSNYYRWMERAENALFKKLGLKFVEEQGDKFKGWPRVKASCEFKHPLRFQDVVEINLKINAVKNCSICYQFIFYKIMPASKPKLLVAQGEMVTVFAKFHIKDPVKVEAALLEEKTRAQLESCLEK